MAFVSACTHSNLYRSGSRASRKQSNSSGPRPVLKGPEFRSQSRAPRSLSKSPPEYASQIRGAEYRSLSRAPRSLSKSPEHRSRSRGSGSRSKSPEHRSQSPERSTDVHCLGCPLTFDSYADMIVHLESMGCMSGLDTTALNSLAAQCRYYKDFMNPEARMELLHDSMDFPSRVDRPFWCPCCPRDFASLSGLFAHCERHSSEKTHRSGSITKLQEWLDDATNPK